MDVNTKPLESRTRVSNSCSAAWCANSDPKESTDFTVSHSIFLQASYRRRGVASARTSGGRSLQNLWRLQTLWLLIRKNLAFSEAGHFHPLWGCTFKRRESTSSCTHVAIFHHQGLSFCLMSTVYLSRERGSRIYRFISNHGQYGSPACSILHRVCERDRMRMLE